MARVTDGVAAGDVAELALQEGVAGREEGDWEDLIAPRRGFRPVADGEACEGPPFLPVARRRLLGEALAREALMGGGRLTGGGRWGGREEGGG